VEIGLALIMFRPMGLVGHVSYALTRRDPPHHLPCLSDSAVEIGWLLNIMLTIGCWLVDTDL